MFKESRNLQYNNPENHSHANTVKNSNRLGLMLYCQNSSMDRLKYWFTLSFQNILCSKDICKVIM